MQRRPFDGYPDSFGAKRAAIFPHAGPAVYVQTAPVAGTVPIVGGDVVSTAECGLKYFDKVEGGVTDDGAFTVSAIPVSVSALVGGPSKTYRLKWVSNVTAAVGGQNQVAGTEAIAGTNLSAEIVRLMAHGPK